MKQSSQLQPMPLPPLGHGEAPCWSLAFCWKSEPRGVDLPEEAESVVRRFEAWCRAEKFLCLTDAALVAPARSVRALLKPAPRIRALVTALLPGPQPIGGLAGPHGFAELQRLHHTLFWVPWKVIPTLEQVERRLARIEATGAGPLLGSLSRIPDMPPILPEEWEHPAEAEIRRHEERLIARPEYADLQYDSRRFFAQGNTPNGDVQPGLRFAYHQQNGEIWAWYEGSGVHCGSLIARKTGTGALRMAYQHLNDAGELRAGQCVSFPEFLPDGHLRMHEYWRWSSGDRSAGASQIEEIPGITVVRKLT